MERIKTKDRILFAALDLFSEKGYDQTSIDLVAEAVGIKGPSIYAPVSYTHLTLPTTRRV